MMKKIAIVIAVFLVIVSGGTILYKAPIKIVHMSPQDVSRISIFCDKKIDIKDSDKIESVINNLSNITFRRDKPSGLGGRMQYLIRIYNQSDEKMKEICICDNNKIDDGTFFYHTVDNTINLDYIKSLVY